MRGGRRRDQQGAQATARPSPAPANISSKDELQRLVDETNAAFGKIDILVCNAASNPYYGPMAGITDEQFTKILANNIISNHWLIQMVAPQMSERKDGAIIIVSSIGGLRGSTVIGAYCISKAADMQLARNLAAELGPDNIRVNCIAPGLVKTDFAKALWEDPTTPRTARGRTPLRRIGEPDDIAGAAVFFASSAGAFTTGQTLVSTAASPPSDPGSRPCSILMRSSKTAGAPCGRIQRIAPPTR